MRDRRGVCPRLPGSGARSGLRGLGHRVTRHSLARSKYSGNHTRSELDVQQDVTNVALCLQCYHTSACRFELMTEHKTPQV